MPVTAIRGPGAAPEEDLQTVAYPSVHKPSLVALVKVLDEVRTKLADLFHILLRWHFF
jgi:hypothetical protein